VIVAIDGPSGSGKSSTAKAIARATGFIYLDTGAMYRAVALLFIENKTEISDRAASSLLESFTVDIAYVSGELRVSLSGRDVTAKIRTTEVTAMSSRVSTLSSVRQKMVHEQRRIAGTVSENGESVIVEGRDIGTVVFPDADVKVFMDASPAERAKRRHAEIVSGGSEADLSHILHDMKERDARDRSRELSPLIAADDAIIIDTTRLTFDAQIELILSIIRERR
jgi:CMP/dCMP kinase